MKRRKQNRENYGDTSLTRRRKSVAPKSLFVRRKIKESILMVNIIPDIIADSRNEIVEYNSEILASKN